MAVGCSSTNSSNGNAAQSCRDTVDALAKAFERCGTPYATASEAIVKSAANGDCNNVNAIRDEASLRQVCLPSLTTLQCSALTAGNLDASCRSQLQHPASFTPSVVAVESVSSVSSMLTGVEADDAEH